MSLGLAEFSLSCRLTGSPARHFPDLTCRRSLYRANPYHKSVRESFASLCYVHNEVRACTACGREHLRNTYLPPNRRSRSRMTPH